MTKVTNQTLFSARRLSVNLVTYPQGHKVLRHNDPMGSGRYYKLNVVLQKPEKGGVFHADKLIFSLFNRVFLFRPDLHSHSVTKIEQGQRKLLSVALNLPG
ncbi:2OG-Fe(II) oxygenase [Alteromonas sp. ASW11-19]|uniref:2OG-Fe(II) oxygenase n=1 Tax=Alteromonas salexigens TaxID=2982530 RepID=A0ABT2VP84_9ALTE|nr:2OG-Fe(II) oxygenase [Alteromonas salexigens]MCU7555102.1 2OG-Fe(II) oxygenase [Alteromonas salexigens]